MTTRDLISDSHDLARGDARPPQPLEFVQDEGREPCDLIGTTYGLPILVSPRFVDVFLTHGFTGWTTFPVRVFLGDGSELEGYQGFAVTGRAGPIDDSLSLEVILPPPAPGGRARPGLRGACFAPESWDGSDVFVCGESSAITVTAGVRRALEEAQITNVAFKRLSEIERIWRADGTIIDAE